MLLTSRGGIIIRNKRPGRLPTDTLKSRLGRAATRLVLLEGISKTRSRLLEIYRKPRIQPSPCDGFPFEDPPRICP